MSDKSFDDLDELMAQIRLRLVKVRQVDPVAGDELKELFRQLEDWVESLVVDSLKLNVRKGNAGAGATPKQKKSGAGRQ